MKLSGNSLAFLIVLLLGVSLLLPRFYKEVFTSPGTMVQLATSHVPTQEDYDYYKNIYPKIVRRDLEDMTGEDPGPIAIPMPQLWF
jgi:hypothetical protein